ncbi:MAG: hypothetical protein AAGJ82_14040 [Bacteroidota bacterium]
MVLLKQQKTHLLFTTARHLTSALGLLLLLLLGSTGLHAQSAAQPAAAAAADTKAFVTFGEQHDVYELSYAGTRFEQRLETRGDEAYATAIVTRYESLAEIHDLAIDVEQKTMRITMAKGLAEARALRLLSGFNPNLTNIQAK